MNKYHDAFSGEVKHVKKAKYIALLAMFIFVISFLDAYSGERFTPRYLNYSAGLISIVFLGSSTFTLIKVKLLKGSSLESLNRSQEIFTLVTIIIGITGFLVQSFDEQTIVLEKYGYWALACWLGWVGLQSIHTIFTAKINRS